MTQFTAGFLVLLALSEEMHRVWGRFDNERPGISTAQIAIAVAAIVIATAVAILWRFMKRRAARTFSSDSAAKLFRQLCAAHGIKRSGRRLMKQLAGARGLSDPAVLFVEPRHFDLHDLPTDLKPSAHQLRALSEMLFD